MVLSVGQIVEFTVKGTLLGQEIRNVDFKRCETLPSSAVTANELCNSYYNEFATRILNKLSNQYHLTGVSCKFLTGAEEIGEYLDDTAGAGSGDAMPSYVAASIILKRATTLTRSGHKRIAGLSESAVTGNNTAWTGTSKDQVESMFAPSLLFSTIEETPEQYEMSTVIVKRVPNGSGGYVLDPTQINDITQASLQPYVTTQNSRKQGVGI